jgi:hypothetical protein
MKKEKRKKRVKKRSTKEGRNNHPLVTVKRAGIYRLFFLVMFRDCIILAGETDTR